jgi:hypothetical protein
MTVEANDWGIVVTSPHNTRAIFHGWLTVEQWAIETYDRALEQFPESDVALVVKVRARRAGNNQPIDWRRPSDGGGI